MKAKNELEVGVASANVTFPSELAMEIEPGHIVFPTAGLLWKTIWGPRCQLIGAMAGKGPMSLRAAARLVGKDVKTVHGDAHALLRNGILKKNSKGQIVFPYDAMHVKFTMGAAAA
jgi:predicted transcriptional regulator